MATFTPELGIAQFNVPDNLTVGQESILEIILSPYGGMSDPDEIRNWKYVITLSNVNDDAPDVSNVDIMNSDEKVIVDGIAALGANAINDDPSLGKIVSNYTWEEDDLNYAYVRAYILMDYGYEDNGVWMYGTQDADNEGNNNIVSKVLEIIEGSTPTNNNKKKYYKGPGVYYSEV